MSCLKSCKVEIMLTTSRQRPKKILVGGFGNYCCCVPGCKIVLYDKNREKTNIYFFNIPKRKDLKQKRFNVLKHIRRKGGDTFDVNNPNKRIIYVCEFYFKDEELKTTMSRGKKKVIPGKVLSIIREKPKKLKYKTTTKESSNISS